MGAFLAAARGTTPVVPVTIRGTRSTPRDGRAVSPPWRDPDRRVRQPFGPEGSDWSAAVRLRDRARAAILSTCGEPDLTPGG